MIKIKIKLKNKKILKAEKKLIQLKNPQVKKKTENNVSKDETKGLSIPIEKMIMTPELEQFIYILRTDIILWSGKHESDVKL